mmetsp:Transcript_17081/g.38623  ORF Transcript_17081/g.38623 Transcript_17081/m.38623 type:complete len:433 (+) Transcript_17081:1514-2812(+)
MPLLAAWWIGTRSLLSVLVLFSDEPVVDVLWVRLHLPLGHPLVLVGDFPHRLLDVFPTLLDHCEVLLGEVWVPHIEEEHDASERTEVPDLVVVGVVEGQHLALLPRPHLLPDTNHRLGRLGHNDWQVDSHYGIGEAAVRQDFGAGAEDGEHGHVFRDEARDRVEDLPRLGAELLVLDHLLALGVGEEEGPPARDCGLHVFGDKVGADGLGVVLRQAQELLPDGCGGLLEALDPGEVLAPGRVEGLDLDARNEEDGAAERVRVLRLDDAEVARAVEPLAEVPHAEGPHALGHGRGARQAVVVVEVEVQRAVGHLWEDPARPDDAQEAQPHARGKVRDDGRADLENEVHEPEPARRAQAVLAPEPRVASLHEVEAENPKPDVGPRHPKHRRQRARQHRVCLAGSVRSETGKRDYPRTLSVNVSLGRSLVANAEA